jgi:hypothetical protein
VRVCDEGCRKLALEHEETNMQKRKNSNLALKKGLHADCYTRTNLIFETVLSGHTIKKID